MRASLARGPLPAPNTRGQSTSTRRRDSGAGDHDEPEPPGLEGSPGRLPYEVNLKAEGAIVLKACLDASSRGSPAVERLAYINAALETGIENPLDEAIVAAGEAAGLGTAGSTNENPYDFMRRRLSIVVEPSLSNGASSAASTSERLMISKGVFEAVLNQCATVADGEVEVPLTQARRARLKAWYSARGEEALRILAVAPRRPPQPDYGMADETDIRFEAS